MRLPWGWIKAELTFKCKWCEHVEVVTVTEDRDYDLNWVYSPNTNALELCSTDCQKERDACIKQTYAALEPQPQWGERPAGYEAKYEELRYQALKVRGLSHRITRAKLL